jgi:glucosamine--fructose-6-phosphate aminotransferase (isomerizing)
LTKDPIVIEGAYLADLMDQPRAVRAAVASLGEAPSLAGVAGDLAGGRYRRVVLTGMGSSYHALYPLHLRLVGRGLPSMLVETSELVHSMAGTIDPGTLLVAVSQSGRSAEVVRLLDHEKNPGFTIGVTNDPGSPVARGADLTLLLRAGAEHSVSCKTYVASLAVLRWLGGALLGDDLRESCDELAGIERPMSDYLSRWRSHAASLLAELHGVRHLFVVGRGSSLAAAGTGGLILKESARFPAEGMSSAAFRHGPFEMLDDRVFVLVFAGDDRTSDLNGRLVDDILKAGARAALAGPDAALDVFRVPEVPEAIRPALEILPAQMISLALAALKGQEAGKFERASKVTIIE